LPENGKLKTFFNDSFIYYKPRNIVSGDFYFLQESTINNEKCKVLAVADCTGHGVPGGFMSVLGMSLLNDIVRPGNFTSAANILDQLRNQIKTALKQTGKQGEQQDGIEMSLIIYFPNEKRIEFAGAENPLYIINNNELTIYKGDNMPIGIHLNEQAFSNIQINLKGNETLYMYTDGITDQMNLKGNRLMAKYFKNWLLEIHEKNGKDQNEILSQKMVNWMKKDSDNLVDQIDDMLLIGFKIQ